MANKRTIIRADEELVVYGNLIIRGDVTQKDVTVINENRVQNNTLILNSDADADAATLRYRHGGSNVANLYYAGENLICDVPFQGELFVPSGGNIIFEDGLVLSGNAVTGNFFGTLTGNVFGDVVGNVTGDLVGNVTGQVSDISNFTTTDLAEGANLYYTVARANAAIADYLVAGTGVTLNTNATNTAISIGQDVSTTSDVEFRDMLLTGNLLVQGETTYLDVTAVRSQDPAMKLQSNTLTSDSGLDVGISFNYYDTQQRLGFMGWDQNNTRYTFLEDATESPDNVFTGNLATVYGSFTGFFDGETSGNVDANVVLVNDQLTIPDTPTTVDGSIYYAGNLVFARVGGVDRLLTPALEVGSIESVGDGVPVYAGDRVDGNITYAGIKSVSGSTGIDIQDVAGNTGNTLVFSVTTLDNGSLVNSDVTYNGVTVALGSSGTLTTTEIPQGANLYYTDALARAAISGTGLIGYNSATGVITTTADNFNNWSVTTDSGSGSTHLVTSGTDVQIVGGTGITVTNAANVLTIENTNAADITSVIAGNGLSGGGTVGDVTLDLDFSELADLTADISDTDEFIIQSANIESRKAASEIDVSVFNVDDNFVEQLALLGTTPTATDQVIVYDDDAALGSKVKRLAYSDLIPAPLTLTADDLTNGAATSVLVLEHTTSGLPAVGIGVGIDFVAETSAGNNELGAQIQAVATEITDTVEEFDLVFKLMDKGNQPAEVFRLESTGNINLNSNPLINIGDDTIGGLVDLGAPPALTDQFMVYDSSAASNSKIKRVTYDDLIGNIAAANVSYDNTSSGLLAIDVQNAIDELGDTKLDISALTSGLVLYPTDTASDISGYTKLVTSPDDPDYDDTAVNISTGTISTSDQLIANVASNVNVLIGNTGRINIVTTGNIRRTSGTGTAQFYFEVYKRTSLGAETLLGTSGNTVEVDTATYQEFFASTVISNESFTGTDRVVLKFYGSKIGGGGDPVYDFEFGGSSPVRTSFPVPFDVIPTADFLPALVEVDALGTATGTTAVSTANSGVAYYSTPSSGNTRTIRLDSADVGTQIVVHAHGIGTTQFTAGTSQILIQGTPYEMTANTSASATCVSTNTWAIAGVPV